MADNNRNEGYRSSYQDWNNEGGRYDDRGNSGTYNSRYEGQYGNQGRYGQDYGSGSTYGNRHESDYNRGNYGNSGRYDREYDRNYSGNRNYENEGYDDRSRNYGSGSDYSGSFRSGTDNWGSRHDRSGTNYSLGGYQNFGGGSGYGGHYFGGGYGGSNFGRSFGSGSAGSSYGNYGGSSYGDNFGGMRGDYSRGNYDRGRNYGQYGGAEYRQRDMDYRGRDYDNRDRGWWDRASDEVSSWFGDEDAERRRRMDKMYRGKGPKNYKRSDDRIREDINDRLSDDWFVDASDIEVTVESGEVILSGRVSDRGEKRRAEDIAENVSGVTHVENRIRVARETETTTPGLSGSSSTASTVSGSTTTGRRQSSVVGETNK